MKRFLLLLLTVFAGTAAADCFDEHAQRYGLSSDLLRAIAITESSGNPKAVAGPKGSEDLGLMQINSQWLKKWKLDRTELLENACLNIDVSSRILKDNFDRFDNGWEAVGAYNVGCAKLDSEECKRRRQSYAWKVHDNLVNLTDSQREKLKNVAS